MEMNNEQLDKVAEQIFARRKIQAIKLCREYAGLGLKEAKEYVDKMGNELAQKFPEKFAEKQSAGCGTAMLFAVLVTIAYSIC